MIKILNSNTNSYPNWIIDQVFKLVKAKQRDTVPKKIISNENEAAQTSNQTTIEKHNDKKHLLWYYVKEEKENRLLSQLEKTIKRLLPSNIKMQKFLLMVTNLVHVSILRTKLSLSTDMM